MKSKNEALQVFDNHGFLKGPEARSLRILGEYLYPASVFKKEEITDTIVFFGSSRIFPQASMIKEGDLSQAPEGLSSKLKDYGIFFEDAIELAEKITRWSILREKEKKSCPCIVTGGGPGIMEAANRGAKKAGGKSIGLSINIPFEPNANPYISENLSFKFHYFFMRKYWFLYYAKAILVFPGGFGTLDELFECLTLRQTKNIKSDMSILLYGRKFWERLIDFDFLSESGMIAPKDLELIQIVDSVPDAFENVRALF